MPVMAVFLQIFSLFLIMGAGWAFARRGYFDREASRGVSNLILKLTLPCLIVVSLQKPFTPELLSLSLRTLALATAFYAAVIALSLLAVRVLRVDQSRRGTLAFALSFSNCAFIGFPVVSSILGEDALFIISIHNVLFNTLAFSAGILMMEGGVKHAVKKAEGRALNDGRTTLASSSNQPPMKPSGALTSPAICPRCPPLPLSRILNVNVLATIVGFLLFVLSIRIPKAILVPMESLGSLTTPLAMIVTGSMLARTTVRSAVGDWRLFAVTGLRLILWPAIAWFVLTAAGVDGMLRAVSVIVAGMPAASNTGIIAEVYGGDTATASSIVFLTTLFSVVSIPLMALVL